MAVLIDSYTGSCDTDRNIYDAAGTFVTRRGQSFASGAGGALDSAVFALKRAGTISGTMYAELYAHTGTYGTDSKPTGSALATSTGVAVSVLTTSYAPITFTFPAGRNYALAAPTDYYSETNFSSGQNLGVTGELALAQAFTGDGTTLDTCQFYLARWGYGALPTGSAVAKLYAMTGTYGYDGKPIGMPLATSAPFNVSALTSSYQLVTFFFDNAYTLANGTRYEIVIDGTGIATRSILVGVDFTSPTHPGNYADTTDNVTWWAHTNWELLFYVNGVPRYTLNYTMAASTNYVIVIHWYGGDSSNMVVANSIAAHQGGMGNVSASNESPISWAVNTADHYFAVYAQDVGYDFYGMMGD